MDNEARLDRQRASGTPGGRGGGERRAGEHKAGEDIPGSGDRWRTDLAGWRTPGSACSGRAMAPGSSMNSGFMTGRTGTPFKQRADSVPIPVDLPDRFEVWQTTTQNHIP